MLTYYHENLHNITFKVFGNRKSVWKDRLQWKKLKKQLLRRKKSWISRYEDKIISLCRCVWGDGKGTLPLSLSLFLSESCLLSLCGGKDLEDKQHHTYTPPATQTHTCSHTHWECGGGKGRKGELWFITCSIISHSKHNGTQMLEISQPLAHHLQFTHTPTHVHLQHSVATTQEGHTGTQTSRDAEVGLQKWTLVSGSESCKTETELGMCVWQVHARTIHRHN